MTKQESLAKLKDTGSSLDTADRADAVMVAFAFGSSYREVCEALNLSASSISGLVGREIIRRLRGEPK